jgi:hypothetical protein
MGDKADIADELASSLGDVRRSLGDEVKLRQAVIKPLERAVRALKDPHKHAVALHEAGLALAKPPEGLEMPRGYNTLIGRVRAMADEKLAELEFSFARDLREAFKERGKTLDGPPTELIVDLFVIKPEMRQKQVQMTFSRHPVTKKAIKLDAEQVVTAYERARREICERNVDLEGLLAELFEAYQRILRLAEKQMGSRMGIVDCYRELILVRQPLSFRRTPSKLSFVDYPKSHFAFDMLELRRRHKLVHEGYRLNFGVATIDVGADSTRAIFLATGATEGQFIKDLYFTTEKAK